MFIELCSLAMAPVLAAAAQQSAPTEIIVTGERTSRSLRQTVSSVAVERQSDIGAAGAHRVQDLLALIPNVQLGTGSQGPAIRGLDTTGPLQALPAFLGGNRPRTTIIVDGRAVTYNEFVFGEAPLWDVERIEVYRSPQTTTQGVNSIAGSIFIYSEEPSFEPDGAIRFIGGDYKTREISAMLTGPLSSDVALRLTGDFRYARTTSHISPEMNGADPNHEASGIIRARLLVQPRGLPNTRAIFTLAHSASQSPQTVGVKLPFEARRDPSPGYGIFRVLVTSATGRVTQDFNQAMSMELQFTAGKSRARRFALPGFGEARNNGEDWSGELVAHWHPNGLVGAVLGVSHIHTHLRQQIDLSLLSGLTGSFQDRQDSTGLFGEANLTIMPKLTLTAGLRYQWDSQRREGGLVTNSFSVPVDFNGRFSALLPKLSVAYDLTPQWRAGVLIEKAYNPGGTTIRFDTARPDNFGAEKLWDTELFARGNVANGRLAIQANLFNYAIKDAQRADPITILTPTGSPVGFANLFNVPRARSRGLEVSTDWRVARAFTLKASAGLLFTKITSSASDAPVYEGKQFDRSPHLTTALAADWRALPNLRLSAQVRHHSSYYSDNANKAVLSVAPATLVDGRAEYALRRVSLFMQVHNIFDKFAMRVLGTPISGEAEEPRRISVGIEARFQPKT